MDFPTSPILSWAGLVESKMAISSSVLAFCASGVHGKKASLP